MIAPPLEASKTCAPRRRSISSTSSAAASTGNAISTSIEVSSAFQVNIGIRNIVMPGACMQKIVVMKLTPPRMVPRPDSVRLDDPQVAPIRRVDGAGQRPEAYQRKAVEPPG